MEEKKNSSALNISGFVCGIISILSFLFYYISLPTGIISIICSAKGIKKSGSKLAKAGLVLGIVGLSLCVLVYIFFITVIALA